MRNGRIVRTLAVLASAGLILGAFVAAPADAKKKKKPKACAEYVPGETGAEAETTVVTDAATAEKPVEVTLDTGEGLGLSSADGPDGDYGHTNHAYTNVQVDSAGDAGLYVRVEFPEAFDYDIFLRSADGTALAYAAGFNQGMTPAGDPSGLGLDGTGHGGHSEMGAEMVDGWIAADCEGFTLDVVSAITPGGEVTVKYWLGEAAS